MSNPFDRMMNPRVSDIELGRSALPSLGAPLAQGSSGAPLDYADKQFTNADFILFGVSNGTAGGITIGAGLDATLKASVTSPFKPMRLCIASTIAPGLFVRSIKIGAIHLVDGDPFPAELLSEVALTNAIDWPTAQTAQPIEVVLLNASGADIANVALAILGIRAR